MIIFVIQSRNLVKHHKLLLFMHNMYPPFIAGCSNNNGSSVNIRQITNPFWYSSLYRSGEVFEIQCKNLVKHHKLLLFMHNMYPIYISVFKQ